MAKTIDSFTQNQTRLVVIIDGLDACEQDKVLQMLDTVSNALLSFSLVEFVANTLRSRSSPMAAKNKMGKRQYSKYERKPNKIEESGVNIFIIKDIKPNLKPALKMYA